VIVTSKMRAAARVEQHAVEGEALDSAVNDRVGALRLALHAQALAAPQNLAHHGVGEARLDPVAQRLVLERGHRHRLDVRGQPRLAHGLVAAAEARREQDDGGERGPVEESLTQQHCLTVTPQAFRREQKR